LCRIRVERETHNSSKQYRIPEQGHHNANFEIEALEAARGASLQRRGGGIPLLV